MGHNCANMVEEKAVAQVLVSSTNKEVRLRFVRNNLFLEHYVDHYVREFGSQLVITHYAGRRETRDVAVQQPQQNT